MATSCAPLAAKSNTAIQRMITVIVLLALLQLLPQDSLAQITGDSLTIEISRDGQAKVTEEITPSTTVSRITVSTITSDISNILAVDENHVVLSFSHSGASITIDTLGSANVTLTYDANIVSKATSDIWELKFDSTEIQSTIFLPPMSDIIYVNDIPIDIVDNIVTMPPGETSIRYKVKSVTTKNFGVSWDGKEYTVDIVTASSVQEFNFEQNSKSIALTLDTSTPMLAIMPRALLGGPYTVTGPTGNMLEFREYHGNATHSWIRVEPNDANAVRIVGTSVVPEFPFNPLSAGMAIAITMLLTAHRRSTLRHR